MYRIPLIVMLLVSIATPISYGQTPAKSSIIAVKATHAQEGREPRYALDGNLKTTWTALGKGQYLQVELSEPIIIKDIHLGFDKGNPRRYSFEIQISSDGKSFITDSKHTTSGKDSKVHPYPCKGVRAKYIRIVNQGNTVNDWINLHTLKLDGVSIDIQHVNIYTPGDLTPSVYAQYPMVASPVAITFDEQNNAYITQTTRRKAADLDIRRHTQWIPHDLSFQTIEDKLNFYHEHLGQKKSTLNKSWLIDRNKDHSHDYRDLTVLKDKVIFIQDTDNDSRADKSHVYHAGFNTEISGIAAGILHHNRKVYVTAIPSLYELVDTDNNHEANQVKTLHTGFGPHIAYAGHDMHGLTIGPDGRLYWSIGDKGSSVVRPEDGKRFHFPNHGAVFRCELDGSNFEVFAYGLRNTQELAFNEYGDLISVDNDSDKGADRERIVHIVEGSDSGWRCNWQYIGNAYNPWLHEQLFKPYHKGQAAYILPAVANYSDGPAGFAYNPGTALTPDYKHHYFLAEFTGSAPNGKISAFTLKPKGASYELATSKRVMQGALPTGITFGPDGSLYVCDWINGWEPKDQGKIWRISASLNATDQTSNPATKANIERYLKLQQQTRDLISADFSKLESAMLYQHLAHADQRVRLKAQFELTTRGRDGLTTLMKASTSHPHQLARLHAIWGIGQFARKKAESAATLVRLLNDTDSEVRAQAAKVLGDSRFYNASTNLIKLLNDASPRVRFHTAIALGKLGSRSAVRPLIDMLLKTQGQDPYLRHATIHALELISDIPQIVKLKDNPDLQIRLAAVVALRRLKHPDVATFLKDTHTLVRVEAARAIHDDFSIPDALPALAATLNQSNDTNPAYLLRAINANFRLGTSDHAVQLARYAGQETHAKIPRIEALKALAVWASPPVLDRLESRYRKHSPRPAQVATKALKPYLKGILKSQSEAVILAGVDAAQSLKIKSAAPHLARIIINRKHKAQTRIHCMQTLFELNPEILKDTLGQTLADTDSDVRREANRWLARTQTSPEVTAKLLFDITLKAPIAQRQQAIKDLAELKIKPADEKLTEAIQLMAENKLPLAIHLDLINAATLRADQHPPLKAAIVAYKKGIDTADPMGGYRITIEGGNAKKGKDVFMNHVAAQCIRCHTLNNEGGKVAPDLTDIAARLSRQKLLESLINPNAVVAAGYGLISIEMKDGSTRAGVLKAETDKELIITPPMPPAIPGQPEPKIDLTPSPIAKSDIASFTKPLSSMPPMGDILKKHELRDLIEFLATLKKAK